MRLRDLEAELLAAGWQPEPQRGGVTCGWVHPASGKRLTYHRPHGSDASEVKRGMVRRVRRRMDETMREAS